MNRIQADVTDRIDATIDELLAQPLGEEPREYLDALRVLLKSQVTAYLSYVTSRRDALTSTTSTMYADEFSPDGPLPTTLRGLIERGTMTSAQAGRLASNVLERRTVLIFGDRATGKSTLLNALLDLVPVDERMVSIEHARSPARSRGPLVLHAPHRRRRGRRGERLRQVRQDAAQPHRRRRDPRRRDAATS